MAGVKATWRKVVAAESEALRRSSHVCSVVGSRAYIFGGELRPREPRDNDVHVVEIGDVDDDDDGDDDGGEGEDQARNQAAVKTVAATPNSPSPRVGSASATLGGKVYMFSGRGGPSMSPIEEDGSVWELEPSSSTTATTTTTWSILSPADADAPRPVGRSYHGLTSDGQDSLYLHAGCPETGRLADLWAFSVSRRSWRPLAAAPGPARGGTSVAYAWGLLYRMHGFDGQREQGGQIDVYDPVTDEWRTTHAYEPDGVSGPTRRSVGTLVPITVRGRRSLVTAFGEVDPSSQGHQGAGRMSDDVWLYDIGSETWSRVETHGGGAGGPSSVPCGRGWLAADVLGTSQTQPTTGQALFHGGLGESNERLGDVWILSF